LQGYYGNDRATREAIEPDGWLHTGDVAVADDAGYFCIVDRRKDMLITGGFFQERRGANEFAVEQRAGAVSG
jgi:long-subunit acyl-CoA synthetase (AMP-forming)